MALKLDIPGAHFDSELRTTMVNATVNAELTIVLRVWLQKVDAKTAGYTYPQFHDASDPNPAKMFDIRDWDEKGKHSTGYRGEYADFTHRYQLDGQSFWTGKYWLQTPNDYAELDWPAKPAAATHRPNIWCRFRLELANSLADHPHKTIQLIRLDRKSGTSTTFRSDDSHYDNFDLQTATYNHILDDKGKEHTYYQRTFVHEIGHALGLAHIGVLLGNPVAVAHPNGQEAYGYGTLTPTQSANIMGYGMNLTAIDAAPWVKAVAAHTGTAEAKWKVFMKDHGHWPHPRPLKTIPMGPPGP
ncbi:MAG TPA: hypothetical protein VMS17_24295 [Gemmataceae bacterium]|nr:hypothetical protein [Gemmataceae bacterium]